jgi:adenine-specific DNA-methyltransferase
VAAIDDLIAQVEDKALRERLQKELDRLARGKKFGLVFEEHLPELTPVYSASIQGGCLAALRNNSIIDTWRVLSVDKGIASCVHSLNRERHEIPVNDLVVVRQCGDPIFPSLIPLEKVQNSGNDAPWHILIEADNYHALQLLEYVYTGQVDCIYIDPPYNTGARFWKYNNDYVDDNDRWRHSKWLAMIKRRLLLAKRLLKADGVLIITIDENEVHHLGMLLEDVFQEFLRHMVTIVINPKGTGKHNFARVDEYAIFCVPNLGRNIITGLPSTQTVIDEMQDEEEDAEVADVEVDLVDDGESDDENLPFPPDEAELWELRHGRRRGGESSYRHQRRNQFYPLYVDPELKKVVRAGESIPLDEEPDFEPQNGLKPIWPIDDDGNHRCWRFISTKMQSLIDEGRVVLGRYNKLRDTWTINIWEKKPETKKLKTVWWETNHDAGTHGTTLLHKILKRRDVFPFPKSIYAVRDCLAAVVRNRPDALIIDFFAGSGSTLQAVDLLNKADNGRRRCVLVTNNELPEKLEKKLHKKGYFPGDFEWEKHGVCRSVTWPRCKYTILGHRDDSTELEGDYLIGRRMSKEKPRSFKQIGFINAAELNTVSKKKQLLTLIEGLPQSEVKKDSAFVVSEKHVSSILFDEDQADAWMEALADQKHISDFYIITKHKAAFDVLKSRINAMLGPIKVIEDEKCPMRDGLPANLEYFKLDFLDKDQVALGRQFKEILPILWIRAGAVGPRPELHGEVPIPDMLIPVNNRFAVLNDETQFAAFKEVLVERDDITHVFLVTDSEEAFQEMAPQLAAQNVVQLYRNYLENFMINKEVWL